MAQSHTTATPFFPQTKAPTAADRRSKLAAEFLNSMLQNPNCPSEESDDDKIVTRAITLADKLLDKLDKTQAVIDRLNAESSSDEEMEKKRISHMKQQLLNNLTSSSTALQKMGAATLGATQQQTFRKPF